MGQPTSVASPLRTFREAAEYLRVSERTISTWVAKGYLKALRMSGRRMIHQDELEKAVTHGLGS